MRAGYWCSKCEGWHWVLLCRVCSSYCISAAMVLVVILQSVVGSVGEVTKIGHM